MRQSFDRLLTAVVLAVTVAAFVAGPIGAATTLVACDGTCGTWAVFDSGPPESDGATCSYRDNAALKSITVRPPKMKGNYANRTPVWWRFKIRYSSSPTGSSFSTMFRSSWQKSTASQTSAAYAQHGFTARTWNVASPPPHGRYVVWLEMAWYRNGSRQGFARAQIDYYKQIHMGNTYHHVEHCTDGLA